MRRVFKIYEHSLKFLNYRNNCSPQIPYSPDRENSASHSSPIKHFPHILMRKYLLDFSKATLVVDFFRLIGKRTIRSKTSQSAELWWYLFL
jgi:hypothetical protein